MSYSMGGEYASDWTIEDHLTAAAMLSVGGALPTHPPIPRTLLGCHRQVNIASINREPDPVANRQSRD